MEADNPLNNQEQSAPQLDTAPAPTDLSSEGQGLPDPSGMNLKKPKSNKKTPIIIGAVVGLIVLVIVVLVFVSINNSKVKQEQLTSQYNSGYENGKTEQKAASDKEFLEKESKNVRVYKAPQELGNFELPIPKSWSFAIKPDKGSGTFFGKSDPDLIDENSEYHVFSVDLSNSSYANKIEEYDSKTKDSQGKIESSDVKVSGVAGKRYKGVFDKDTGRKAEVVVVPLREKVMVFKTDDPDKYSDSFNNILNATKLNP